MAQINQKLNKTVIKVGIASCGLAAGAETVYGKLQQLLKSDTDIVVQTTGCIGMCYQEPLVEVSHDAGRFIYGAVDEKKAEAIAEQVRTKQKPIEDWVVYSDSADWGDTDYIARQHRLLLRNSGIIDPDSITSYQAVGGYRGLAKAVQMEPRDVIETVEASGLRGRGGAGFPTHLKWNVTREAVGETKYVICNADEGDPGAFMDRSLLESDPHSVLEGMLIAAYAIGASQGFFYIRAEYPLAIQRLSTAIEQARQQGLLGADILGSSFSFDAEIRKGAGAFVCGEETALIASIEGKRGMPRFKPPFPAQRGLWNQPTCINNVETLANVPHILADGPASFQSCGTEDSRGTKVFALAGKVARGGLIEVPMGITLRQIVFDIGGGISSGKAFKAVQTGGPSGGCVPAELADTPVDYEELGRIGTIMGSGGLLVMDEDTCMVDVARFFLRFTVDESCGKCTFCRAGTPQMLEILDRICEGAGRPDDIDRLIHLGEMVAAGSMCGLGQTAPNPVLTTIRYFRSEYEAHINDGCCPAKACKGLIHYVVNQENCKRCDLCRRQCPTEAIIGSRTTTYQVTDAACIRCGLCQSVCKFDAIEIVSGQSPAGSETALSTEERHT